MLSRVQLLLLHFVVISRVSNAKPQAGQSLDTNVNNCVEITFSSENRVQVKITDPESHAIVELPRVIEPAEIDPIDAFYTALSCSIGYVTLSSLYYPIELSPLFYQYKFRDEYGDVYSEEYGSDFENDMVKFKRDVKMKVWLFIRTLNKILNTKPESSYYRQTHTLDALISLYMRVHIFISSFDDDDHRRRDIGKSHYNIVRQFLNEMTAVQRSVSVNCRALSDIGETNTQFYGFYVNVNTFNETEAYGFINKSIDMIGLKSHDRPECSFEEIILEPFVTTSAQGEEFSQEIGYANVIILDNNQAWEKTSSVKNIYLRLKQSYDNRLLFVYQDAILSAVMKTIFREILGDLNTLNDTNVKRDFEELFKIVSDSETVLPDVMVDGFTILSESFANSDEKNIEKIKRFNEKFGHVALVTVNKEATTIQYLRLIFKKIKENIDSFRCFQEIYKHLSDKSKKYYLPNTSYEGTSIPDGVDTNITHFKAVCDFAVTVHALCLQTITFVQKDLIDHFYEDTGRHSDFQSRPFLYVRIILHLFLLVIQNNPADKALMKMAYTVAPILLNVAENEETMVLHPSVIQRVLQVVMAELNNVGMIYCTSSEKNFLLFNQINFHELGNGDEIFSTLQRFYKHSVGIEFRPSDLQKTGPLSIENFKYLSATDLYDSCNGSSKILAKYENVIKFYWHGRVKTLKEIHGDIISIVTNPQHLYGLYDMCFKFYVTAVYYEIKQILSSKNAKNIGQKFEQVKQSCVLQKENFPRGLNSYISDVNNLLEVPSKHALKGKKPNKLSTKLNTCKEKIDKRLVEFNIVIDEPVHCIPRNPRWLLSRCLTPNDDSWIQMFEELSENIEKLYDNFKKIITVQ